MPYYGQQNLSGIGSFAEGLAGGVRGLVGMKTQQREQQDAAAQRQLLAQQKQQQAELKQKADNIQQQLSLSANKDLPPSMRRKALTSALGGMREFNPDMPDYEITDELFESKAVSNGLGKLTGFLEKNPNASYEEKNQVAMGWLSTVVDELSKEDASKAIGIAEQLIGDKPKPQAPQKADLKYFVRKGDKTNTQIPINMNAPNAQMTIVEQGLEPYERPLKDAKDDPITAIQKRNEDTAQAQIDKAAGKELSPYQNNLLEKELTSTQQDSLKAKVINDYAGFASKYNKMQSSEVAYLNPTTEVAGFYQLDEGMIAAGYTPEMMESLAKAAGVPTATYLKMRFGIDTGFIEEAEVSPKKNVARWWIDKLSGKSN